MENYGSHWGPLGYATGDASGVAALPTIVVPGAGPFTVAIGDQSTQYLVIQAS
jgi:hypothetical protein